MKPCRTRTLTTALAAAAVAAAGLTGCGDREWCEHDQTDTQVDDRYCEDAVPGYEWETDDHHTHPKPAVTIRTTKPAPVPAPVKAAPPKPAPKIRH
ncbi:hypothetical protein ACPESR_25405 [Nocardia testacea]|uniref:hypothetical protein n=1 Tax=Nocardia testacea TaxID=248551 RepID=UPI003C30931D